MDQKPSTSSDEALSLASLSLKETESSMAGVDYLSQLPPELLRKIFRLAYLASPRPLRPLSRSLGEFHYELAFEGLVFDCWNCFGKFLKAILQYPHLGAYVKVLIVSAEDAGQGVPQRTPPPKAEDLMKFLKKLLHLRILSVAEASPLVSILLKPGFAMKALKRMEILEIKSSLLRPVRRPHPFGPGLYAALSHYPSLTSFTLQIERKANEYVPLSFVPHPSASQPFRRLRTLDLSGRLDENSIKGILFGCEALTELHLTDSTGDLDLVQAVRSLPSIASLRKLTLRSFHAEDEPPQVEIASFLREARLLDSLNLLGPFDTTSPSFLEALYSLPLRTLAIGCNTPLLPLHILSLLHPKTRHPTLRALDLDNVFAIRGVSTHPDDISDVYFTEDGEPTVPEGWIPPFWPEDKSWTPEIVEQVREAADEAGVKTRDDVRRGDDRGGFRGRGRQSRDVLGIHGRAASDRGGNDGVLRGAGGQRGGQQRRGNGVGRRRRGVGVGGGRRSSVAKEDPQRHRLSDGVGGVARLGGVACSEKIAFSFVVVRVPFLHRWFCLPRRVVDVEGE